MTAACNYLLFAVVVFLFCIIPTYSQTNQTKALCYSGSNLYQQLTQNCNSESSYSGEWYCAKIEVCEQFISSARDCIITRGCATQQQCTDGSNGIYSNSNLQLIGGVNPAGMTITISCCLANNFASDDTVAIDYTKICNSSPQGSFPSLLLAGSIALFLSLSLL